MKMELKLSGKYNLLPSSNNEASHTTHSSFNMPFTTLHAIILYSIYFLPIVGFGVTFVVKPAFLCVDSRLPSLYTSTLSNFVGLVLHLVADSLYVRVYGQDGDRDRSETFQMCKTAALYLISCGVGILIAAMPSPQCTSPTFL